MGVRPAGSGAVSPSSRAFFSAATRTMKNSSRLDATMVANFSRSRSGVDGSVASSRTRPLNSSQDTSRLRNEFGLSLAGLLHRGPASRNAHALSEDLGHVVRTGHGGEALHGEVSRSFDLQRPVLVLRRHPDVLHLLQMVGVEGVGDPEYRRQLVDDHARVPVEGHVGDVGSSAGSRADGIWPRSPRGPCRRGRGRRSPRPRGGTGCACDGPGG